MKKLVAALALIVFLWLNGCYYSGYERLSQDNYVQDTTYYYSEPVIENPPSYPPVISLPAPLPISGRPVQPNPQNKDKYRNGSSDNERVGLSRPESYRESERNIDMNSVRVKRQNNNTGSVERK